MKPATRTYLDILWSLPPREACRFDMRHRTTRELLLWLRCSRLFGGWYSPVDGGSDYGVTTTELKAELATREHVPNRHESRAARRAAALEHRKNKRRPLDNQRSIR